MPGPKYPSSFGGKIKEISSISVDNFRAKTKKAYFLSHVHSDHIVGLYNTIKKPLQNDAKIYMTEASKIILISMYSKFANVLKKKIKTIEVGKPHTVDLPDEESFEVTMIPVTHMIGAVMFLFKTKTKTVLYTGDFVIEEDKIIELTQLHDESGYPLKIDTMYVDATFDNDKYKHFPSRSLCYTEVVNEIENWLSENDRRVALYHNYMLGYEDIHKEIKKAMNMRLFPHFPKMIQIYSALYGKDTVLTNESSSKIHICKNENPNESHKGCGVSGRGDIKYLHIYVSAWKGDNRTPGQPAISKETDQSMYLCYPTHCSKSQLDAFIMYFKPKETVKFPTSKEDKNKPKPKRKIRGYKPRGGVSKRQRVL